MKLHDFINLPHRFRWGGIGGDDCMTFAASWALESCGVDPAAELRGAYKTQDEAHSIMQSHGGAVPFMEKHLVAIGGKRIQAPHDGDIGLVRVMTGEDPADMKLAEVGAIRFGPLWACIHPGGVRVTSAEFIAAWRLPV